MLFSKKKLPENRIHVVVISDTQSSRARAFPHARLVVMSRDTWNPEVDDTSVPLVGEWKYPVDRPSGPVVCSSRVVSVLGVEGLRKQTMRLGAGPDASQTGKPTQNATCFVHYDMWQANDTHQEVWSTRRESEAHQIVFGDASRVHEAFENATTMTNEAKRGSQGLKENNETSLQTNRPVPVPVHSKRKHHVGLDACLATMAPGERSLFRIPHQLAYGELGNFSFPNVPPACDLICDLELIGVKSAAEEPVARVDMLYEERIERVKKLRLEGNALYRAGDFTSAQSQYEMALSFLTDDMLMQLHGRYLDEGTRRACFPNPADATVFPYSTRLTLCFTYLTANSEKLPAHLNLSACFLHQQRYHECIDQASRALAMDSKNAKAFYRRGRARQVLGQDDDARSDLLNALKNARTYWAFPKSRHTVYCPSVTVIKRKYTTGNSYQYSRLLQIYHKCTARPDYSDCLLIHVTKYTHTRRLATDPFRFHSQPARKTPRRYTRCVIWKRNRSSKLERGKRPSGGCSDTRTGRTGRRVTVRGMLFRTTTTTTMKR